MGPLLSEVRALVDSGCHVLGCASLDDAGRPRYSAGVAGQLVAAGMPVAASARWNWPAGWANAWEVHSDDHASPVTAEVAAAALESLPTRLRKRADSAAAKAANWPVAVTDATVVVRVDDSTTVTHHHGRGGDVRRGCRVQLSARAGVSASCGGPDAGAAGGGDGRTCGDGCRAVGRR